MIVFGFYIIIFLSGCGVMLEQGLNQQQWSQYKKNIDFDANGIPTISATGWEELIELQGFTIASERLWQMDLMRRVAAGELSEWFGSMALKYDTKQRQEFWRTTAEHLYSQLPQDEKKFVDEYTHGVNRFIKQYKNQWGYEYYIMAEQPRLWSGSDSMLILMTMANNLSTVIYREEIQGLWKSAMSEDWAKFLFSTNHPWNKTMFGESNNQVTLPKQSSWLPISPIAKNISKELANVTVKVDDSMPGSNNWVWRDKKHTFVVNDPHLGYGVPMIWYAMRMRVSADEWVVGTAIPGIPGIILGMNQSIAWGFTNLREDVDDLLKETLNDKKTAYLDKNKSGKTIWKPIKKLTDTIKVKHSEDVSVEVWRTHRGPLSQKKYLGEDYYSRQWLGFFPQKIRIATIKLNRAKDWEDFNKALDVMLVPAQNVVMADRHGNIGYRSSGQGIIRNISGRVPQPAINGEWRGFKPVYDRPRQWISKQTNTAQAKFIATANERIWIDEFDHGWGGNERKERIESYLSSHENLTMKEMKQLQLDTKSRLHGLILNWMIKHSTNQTTDYQLMVGQWEKWDHHASSAPEVFTDAVFIQDKLFELLISKVKKMVLKKDIKKTPYLWARGNAWLIKVLSIKNGLNIFGHDNTEVANWLAEKVIKNRQKNKGNYSKENQWKAQHPFVKTVPFLGKKFKIKEYPQPGYSGLVRKESPHSGATTRLIWDMNNPSNSQWIFPVGQSGHAQSQHFSDFQEKWHQGQYINVLDSRYEWH